jgi:hypothetical protein
MSDLETVDTNTAVADRDAEQKAVERALWVTVFKSSLLAIPICVGIWVGLVYLAIGDSSQGLVSPLIIGALIGVIAGVFFGGWAGFLKASHTLDEVDSRATRH